MAGIKNVEVQGFTQWINSTYIDDLGQEYEVVFTKSYTENIGFEERTVVNIEKSENVVYDGDPIWDKIRKAVEEFEEEAKDGEKEFTVKIDMNWLKTLSELIEQILVCSPCSPEEAIEVGIFRQIKKQLES